MVSRRNGDQSETEAVLRHRVAELESQLASQQELQGLIDSLWGNHDELRVQQHDLIEAQRELESSRDRYAELFDFAPVPILQLNSVGTMVSMNLAAARLMNIDRAHGVGMPLHAYLTEGTR